MKTIKFLIVALIAASSFGQVGINTETPILDFIPWKLYQGLNWETQDEHDNACYAYSNKIIQLELPKTK